ncbi:MAG: cohesin domain-containing protein [Candidatus Dojkabacteria bacterium]|jgi:hypothetical protein
MIILSKMRVKKFLTIIFSFLFFFFFSSSAILAAEPSFSFFPAGGIIIDKSKGFSVDVLIDTAGQEVMSAKFVVLFDPTVLRLTKAERNSTLFSQWPEEESSIDNDNGVVMLGGFTQSGTGSPYKTSGNPDIIARLTFEILKEKETYLDWEYDTNNGVFDTNIMQEGSPPMNILTKKPSAVTFQIGGSAVLKPDVATGIFDSKYLIIVGAVLLLFGGFMIFTRPNFYRRGRGTVVVIGDNENR